MTTALEQVDLSVREQRIKIAGTIYVLREPTEGAVFSWNSKQFAGVAIDDKGEVKLSTLKYEQLSEANIELVGNCLFSEAEATKQDGAPVGAAYIRRLPSRAAKALLAALLAMADLERKDAKAVNDAPPASLEDKGKN